MQGGGAEEIMRLTLLHFLKQGDEIHVFFLLEKRYGHWEYLKSDGVHLYYSLGGGKKAIFSVIRNFWKVRNIKFDYSFSSIVLCTGIVGLMRRLGILDIKHVVGRESTLVFNRFKGPHLWLNKLMYRLGYPAVELLICQTQLMKIELLKNLPWLVKRTKVAVIPNPVDIEKMLKLSCSDCNTGSYKPYIVAAGRVHPVKGFDILIRSFAALNNIDRNVRLLILGGERGDEKDKLESLSRELGIEDNVTFLGQVPNVYPYFRHASLCVVSSRIEGFPNVLLQMMSQNEKVVSTTCAGGIDQIKGLFTCPPEDAEALAKAMDDCLAADTSVNRKLFDDELGSRSIDKFVQRIIDLT